MARKSTPQPLTLVDPKVQDYIEDSRSPLSPKSPKTPRSPFRFASSSKKIQGEQQSMQGPDIDLARSTLPTTVSLSAFPPPAAPATPATSTPTQDLREGRERAARTGFFSNYKASKSSSRLQNSETVRQVGEDSMSRDTERPVMSGKVSGKETYRTESSDRSTTRRPVGGPSRSEISLDSPSESPPASAGANPSKKSKPKPFSLLSRTKSIRDDQSPRELSPTDKVNEPEKTHTYSNSVMTAPLPAENERTFRSMMNSTVRQRSEDRFPTSQRDRSTSKEGRMPRDAVRGNGSRDQNQNGKQQASFSNTSFASGGHTFLNNLKSSATKGAGAISKGLFGKGGRSGTSSEREPVVDDEHYQLKVMNLPLVEQTRLTRISKKLEDSRDKTEFWMPAFPWRAIDYLNFKGSDVEGLYRVPGSGPQVKKWQRRFDEQLDINLFEQDDLYDINIIGSMLKAWLRELPDELLPKPAQGRIAKECAGAEKVPQMLIDELSNLPPFNYYLLFAITCHLSLLLAHSEKNKMDFRNLCICFQPCMKIDSFCFKFLVCDWRDCWKGCKTEQFYVEQEYMLFDMLPPSSAEGRSSNAVESHDEHERNVSSSDSSKPSTVSIDNTAYGKNKSGTNKKLPLSNSQSSSMNTISTTLTVVEERTTPRMNIGMRPLSPIKPLSPIGL